ncbi:alanine racemase [Planctomicrobium piriforme]|uniref:D-serine deaminase, pyridoxal phosphate-dependent n=1 Tax=Planctomicrobium piriforme TaxID=1576369 RepID=A0A1I3F4F6_9PLAN|nr:alanine racemase [Planctomicrobium piriforme]SFI06087.1 D-serine deaminase, pyridoxal phosphate-dependent [Planctomicrobium piriforme]
MLIGCRQSELETPALCLDLDRFDDLLRTHASLWQQSGKQWRPGGLELLVPALAQRAIDFGAFGIDCGSVANACHQNRSARDLLVSTIVAGKPQLERVVELCRQADVTLLCDHYAQAEAISDICLTHQLRPKVLIEVNVGLNRSGVRPGTDARDLALGLERLKGIKLAGVAGNLGRIGREPARDEKWLRSRVALLTELRDALIGRIPVTPIVSVAATGSLSLLAEMSDVTEVRTGSLLDSETVEQHPLRILATVISRPKLERGVLDLGRSSLGGFEGHRVTAAANGRSLPDADITEIDEQITTLSLGPDAQNLVIGDTVLVSPAETQLALRLHSRLYGVRQGMVEAVWDMR